ncbi:hypothetical protein cypCar_00044260 [Cyprinus carpio]|nr:hypothetical protein cypCar_00044260 [Cyprinus carpio]
MGPDSSPFTCGSKLLVQVPRDGNRHLDRSCCDILGKVLRLSLTREHNASLEEGERRGHVVWRKKTMPNQTADNNDDMCL